MTEGKGIGMASSNKVYPHPCLRRNITALQPHSTYEGNVRQLIPVAVTLCCTHSATGREHKLDNHEGL